MPEEVNRLVTDTLADLLWTPSEDANENLRREGVSNDRVEMVGNIMIDSYELQKSSIKADDTARDLSLALSDYAVVTLHRPSNVDDSERLHRIISEIESQADRLTFVFPLHPRTRANLERFGLVERLMNSSAIRFMKPLGYTSFMSLVSDAKVVITDSGGIQEETTYLNIPCLTLRPNTERPVTITHGTNRLVNPEDLGTYLSEVLSGGWRTGQRPPGWDGQTAQRCVDSLRTRLFGRAPAGVGSQRAAASAR